MPTAQYPPYLDTGLDLGRNTSLSYEDKTAPEWTRYRFGLLDKKLEPVMMLNCEGVRQLDADQ